MKDAKQFLTDLKQDPELAKALEELAPQVEEAASKSDDPAAARAESLAAFAKEHGYEFDPEELSLASATNREVDDDALQAVAGGGRGWCFADYACEFIWNSCAEVNECFQNMNCRDRAL
ncbi:MAG: Nif11-like leader peptide family natural product precursor [Coriobacteriia bacterium]|nr:Nif11-like leader peptide family natural product precursor [Coriobacteriia bacterium]